jgi:DNA-binding CsgD family transcriptional regulator
MERDDGPGHAPTGLAFVVGDQGVVASIVAHLAARGVRVAEGAHIGAALVLPPGLGQRLAPPALSAREMQVAMLVAQGLDNRTIAGRLGLSRNTVAQHVRHSLAKLHFTNRAQLAVWVAGHGSRP